MTTVALAGNPNSGKTTLFNRLTGLRQHVSNYPGVTVERRAGTMHLSDRRLELIDLPGAYSLVPRSRDEAIAFEALTGRSTDAKPEAVVVVVDATNLERNLYLALSILELGLPTLVAVNMMDAVESTGRALDLTALSEALGVPVVGISAKYGTGIDELGAALDELLGRPDAPPARAWRLASDGEAAIAAAHRVLDLTSSVSTAAASPEAGAIAGVPEKGRDGVAVWALTAWGANGPQTSDNPLEGHPDLQRAVTEAESLLDATPAKLAAQIIEARYGAARVAAERAQQTSGVAANTFTDRLDRYLLHPVIGSVVFVAVMAVVFQSVFAWAEPMMGGIESLVGYLQDLAHANLPEGALRALLTQGIIGGVGNILVFVPQIGILFAFIAILEDSGYLARAAFISDRMMARVGLHGRAFVPLLSGFACAVPAIMATRAIETRRDRLVTILVAPLVSCSARLPVYTLLIAALFASDTSILGIFSLGGLMMLGMYALSLFFTVAVAFVLKRTLLASPTPPLVLELPPYRQPEWSSVLRRAYERCVVFIRDAGTVILACSIVLWALLYFPRQVELPFSPEQEAVALNDAYRASVHRERNPERIKNLAERRDLAFARLGDRIEAARVQNSFAGRIGRAIEPVIEPLGYDWKIGIGLLASFAAREVFVSTMGLVYGVGEEADESSLPLRQRLQAETHPVTGAPVYTPLVGLSLMVFFALALQCMSTVAAIRRETNSWQWPLFAVAYTGALAWLAAFFVYQGGRLLGFA